MSNYIDSTNYDGRSNNRCKSAEQQNKNFSQIEQPSPNTFSMKGSNICKTSESTYVPCETSYKTEESAVKNYSGKVTSLHLQVGSTSVHKSAPDYCATPNETKKLHEDFVEVSRRNEVVSRESKEAVEEWKIQEKKAEQQSKQINRLLGRSTIDQIPGVKVIVDSQFSHKSGEFRGEPQSVEKPPNERREEYIGPSLMSDETRKVHKDFVELSGKNEKVLRDAREGIETWNSQKKATEHQSRKVERLVDKVSDQPPKDKGQNSPKSPYQGKPRTINRK